MITVHHLNNSRSQRVLWFLEELGVEYEIKHYARNLETNLAPLELEEVHPLGKSPVLEDDGVKIIETGAIVEYLAAKYGNGKFSFEPDTLEHIQYLEWMHYAEGSAMLPLLLRLYTSRLGDAAEPLLPRIEGEMKNHFSYLSQSLGENDYFVGGKLSAADVMLSFPLEAARAGGILKAFPNLDAFVARVQTRLNYLKALERGGEYAYGPS
jgi:glutathione S-transferase